ncbi:uncharacterized protein LOC125189642 [Salvia hispanica]|uniref:uncharacterized protein LOC125189642 n=1 Tax=Salvia hispanica TaxID=49212 RepID=UPI002008FA6D|nr:uncharacterized protein LOC125189642 [Salvia hispanica]
MDSDQGWRNSNCEDQLQTCYIKLNDCNNDYDAMIERNLDAPMPWIGMYIAAASAICSLAMAADVIRGFRSQKLWLPCNYFSLNATSLTLLTVTMKLTVDLTSSMMGTNDKIASVGSLVLMSTAVGNFMTSVASMESKEILLNLTALAILVITISVNVCIHNVQTFDVLDGNVVLAEEVAAIGFMLVLVMLLCFSSMVVPTTKGYVESKYREMHREIASNGRRDVGGFSVEELRVALRRYWVMAETGSPQFVMARSVISGASGLMCLLMALTLVESYVRVRLLYGEYTESNYKWSINWILHIQSVGVALGTIAPLMRWYVAAWFKISEIGQRSLVEEFKIEKYWTSRVVEWRERPLPLQIRSHKFRKLLHEAKRFLLSISSGVLVFFVLTSKMVIFISALFGKAIFMCFHRNDDESRDGIELDLRLYVLLLEGEAKLPKRIMRNICNELDKLIERSEMKQCKNLMWLLSKSVSFNGVKEFDRNEVPSLYSQEPANSWSLPLVTLTSIAVALPNITAREANQLVSGVGEGLSLVKLVDGTLDRAGEMERVKNAADAVWVGVELYRKWQDKDLLGDATYEETLQKLSDLGEKTVKDFTTRIEDILMQNPLNWPSKVIAANSMYRITQTILLANKDSIHRTDNDLFEKLCDDLGHTGSLSYQLSSCHNLQVSQQCNQRQARECEKSRCSSRRESRDS